MKKFVIDREIFDLFPNLSVGVLVLRGVKENTNLSVQESEEIEKLLDEANKGATKYITSEIISENEVVSIWRSAYQKFPTKKGARCSLENLLKRIIHGNPVGSISPSVDITNSISLKYAFPIGAEDASKISGDLHLGIMNGAEQFFPIGSLEEEKPLKGEVGYKDSLGAVCRCLNWRDGVRTQIDDNTEYEFIAMECLEENRVSDLEKALDELAKLMEKYLNAKIVVKDILNIDNRETSLE